MKNIILICFILLLASGCATVSQSNLYWGKYSHTLYNIKKEPGEASNKAHEEELQSIVETSKEMNLKVPPGIYAELGLFAMKRDDKNAAANYLRLEQETYPESSTLMSRTLDVKLAEQRVPNE